MSVTEDLVVNALNNAKLATKAQLKVQHLGELHELLIKNDTALLDKYMPEVVEFQVDKAASVRRRLLEFLVAAVHVRPTPAVLANTAPCIGALVGDDQVQVARQAAIAAHVVLRAGLAMHMARPQGDSESDTAWAAVQLLQESVSSLSGNSTAEVAVRVAALKLSEQAVLMYTSADALRLPGAAALVTTADGLIKGVCELLKAPGVAQQPGPVIICSMKALGTIALERGNLIGKVLPTLLALTTKGVFKVPVPGDGQSGITASCGATLKDVLVHLMRSGKDDVKAWINRLDGALRAMGAAAVAESAQRKIHREEARLRASMRANEKRKAAEQGSPEAKIPRAATPGGADSSVQNTPARTPTPNPLQAISALLPDFQPSGDPTTDMQRILEGLVATDQHDKVEILLSQLSPEDLAELVLRWMPNLPPKPAAEATAGQDAAAAAQTAPIAGPSAAAAAGQEGAAVAAAAAAQAPAAAAPAVLKQAQGAAVAAPAAAATQQQQQQQQVIDPRRRAPAAPAVDGTGVVQLPSPLPTGLSEKAMQQMRQSAVQRILGATKNRPIRNFRELLLSRLVAQAPQADGLTEMMLRHVLDDYNGRRGHLLLVRWLYSLAAAAATEAAQHQAEDGSGPARVRAPGRITRKAAASGRRQQERPSAAAGKAAAGDAMEGIEQQEGGSPHHQQQDGAPLQQQVDADIDMQDAGATAGGSYTIQQQEQPQQQGPPSGSSSSDSILQDLAGTQYESVLMSALQGLQQQLPSTDPAIPRLLQEVPVLPVNSLVNFFKQLISEGSGWTSLALDSIHSLIDTRPPVRQQLLQLVLEAAVAADPVTREQAMGLIVNNLISLFGFEPVIVDFARTKLLLLLEPQKLMAQQPQEIKQEQQQPGLQGEQQQQPVEKPNGQAAVTPAAEQQQAGQPESSSTGDGQQEQQQQEGQQQQEAAEPELDVEVAAQHCMLFMAVCALKPQLMTVLLETYGKAGAPARAAMDRYAASLARAIGPTNAELLALIKTPPQGSRDLLLAMLNALAETQLPPKELVDACVASFAASKDVQLLAPVTVAMPKSDVIKLLPQLVAQLSRPQLRLLYRKLTSSLVAEEQPHFKPTELLVALHQIKSTAAVRVTTKQQTQALDVALHAPEVFRVADVVQVIRRLESLSPLPQLFMRTVISALQISPKLTDTVMELLKRLITKQIWTNDKQWQGFIICCEKAAPASYPVLLQLPPNILEAALEKINQRHWRELLKYATSKECSVPVFQPVRDVLNLFLERLQNKQKARLAAAAAAGGGSSIAAAAGSRQDKTAAAADGQKQQQATPAAAAAAGAKRPVSGASSVPQPQARSEAVAAVGQPGREQPPDDAGQASQQQQRAAGGSDAVMTKQQQQQADDGGGEDEFMLDFEDD